jgi:hypothetical protein
VYGEDGRLIRSITDPEWTEEDRDEVLAYQLYLDDLCDRCGQPLRLSTNPAKMDDYSIEFAGECFGCGSWSAWQKDHETVPNAEKYRLVDSHETSAVDLPPVQFIERARGLSPQDVADVVG